jgi:hypothetical protein
LPVPQSPSCTHDATQEPLTHFGAAGSVHAESFAQPVGPASGEPPSVPVVPPPVVFGWQTSFKHDVPSAHVPPASPPHGERHCPSAQTLPPEHWLENWQVFTVAVHAPF